MPQPFLNAGSEYYCSKLCIDLEYDSDPCDEQPIKSLAKCRQCCFFEKQDYTIVVQDSRFRKFI